MTPPHRTIAVGGIDTDVGKSYVTGLLARHLVQLGHTVTTLKLVQTGCQEISDDIVLHRRLMEQPLTEFDRNGTTCPYLFPFPASPRLAARMAGASIDLSELDRAMSTLQGHFDWLLVEGAGGLMVPLDGRCRLLDYYAARKLPLVLVTSPRLGSINHTSLSLEAIKARGIRLLGTVYNLFGDHPREIVQDTLAEIRQSLADYALPETVVIVPDIRESKTAGWAPLLAPLD
ncbi:dethiobiotin synthase [Desulfobulbus sp.]|uniref:dethiobiotin synthase n=1 Tax=Desulfobulbus sp. TaxID=895 RepID=UPI00286FA62F|nr:dethiobiotin synthase [Desulfobulbus sp.]